ncbi:hypothetical protein GGR51DRAFT_513994 [Nemania sp. FL0031]|nr:hypothetical protein GGR51DRAFT_513994 [Nemania sp. FL0031]
MRLNAASRPLCQLRDSGLSPWFLALTLFAQLGSSIQLITNDALPSDISEGCQTALLSDVGECSLTATKFRYGYFYPESTLSSTCTTDCASALVSFEKSVVSACSNDTWDGYDDDGMPVAYIPGVMRFLYELACLKDGDRFCNVVAGTNAAMADPGDGESGWLGSVGNGTDAADECDLCFVKSLRLQAGAPYYNGPVISQSSLYESKTSSCSIKDMPLTTTALATTIPEPSPTSTPCAGKMYEIQSGDDCHSISTSQGISTDWLLSDNNLASFCSDFPTSGSLCLVNTCSVYTVNANDTCKSIARSNSITEALLISWNPSISSGCSNIGRLVGQEVCVSVPGTPYKDPASTVLAPTTASTAAPVPTDVAPGVNQNCGRYYQVQPDEYCNLIVLHFGISLKDFQFLNPDINENCTNLYAYESYCILPVGDINTYPGQPGATTAPPTTTLPFTAILSLDPLTTTAPIVTSTALPLAADTREDCARFFDGEQILDEDISTTSYKNACEFAAAVWAISLDDLAQWNPDLGNVTNGECNMVADVRYCGKLLYADPPEAQVGPDYEYDVRTGVIETCTQYADVYPDWDCNDVLLNYELTIAQFYAYNPEVGKDCSNLWTSYAYCIRDPDYTAPDDPSTTTTAPPTSTTPAGPPGPTHTGQPANCNKWHVVVDGDTCPSVEKEYGITAEQFFAWNPAVSTDCTTNFWLGSAYCVGVSSSTTTPTATPTPTSTAPSVPTPTQDGNAVSGCNAYAQAQDGDYCAAFAERNGITDVELYAWNTVLGSAGENCGSSLWSGYWYCIGVMSENRLLELTVEDTA